MLKKKLLILFFLFLVFEFGGCNIINTGNKRGYSEDDKINLVLHSLEEKYNEEFAVKSFLGGGWHVSYDTIICYPKTGTDINSFEVWGSEKDDGTYSVQDTYYGVIIRDEYKEFISRIVSETFNDFQLDLIFESGVYSDKLTKDININEIYDTDNSFSTHTLIYIKQSCAEGIKISDAYKTILQKMADNKLVGSITLYVIKDARYERTDTEPINLNEREKIIDDIVYEGKASYVNKDLSIDLYDE